MTTKVNKHKSRFISTSFYERADSAAFWEAWVGAVLTRAGLHVLHYPFQINKSEDHSLTWDLMCSVSSEVTVSGVKLEVKSVNLSFSSAEEYPYDQVLLCSYNSFNRKWGVSDVSCRDFFIVSRETGNIVWVPIGTEVHTKMVTDSDRPDHPYNVMYVMKDDLMNLSDFLEKYRG